MCSGRAFGGASPGWRPCRILNEESEKGLVEQATRVEFVIETARAIGPTNSSTMLAAADETMQELFAPEASWTLLHRKRLPS